MANPHQHTQANHYRTRIVTDLGLLAAARWDALLPAADATPFMRHAFLLSLQTSGCVGPGTGWEPQFVCLEDRSGQLVAAAPFYVKQHSYGEFVFDWAWAQAYAQHGLDYYPKGVVAVPFSPIPGPRLLAHSPAARAALVRALQAHTRALGLSSLHLLFLSETDRASLPPADFMPRHSVQFHWTNQNWPDFDTFLAALTQPKRKKIRAERRKVAQAGIQTRVLAGSAISARDLDFFFRCYTQTYTARHTHPYLNAAFFQTLARTMAQSLVLVLAERAGRPIASALLMREGSALYGRYWGSLEAVDCLHFETAYYTPLAWAIKHGMARFEGGAQGEHKLARGFLPVTTYSSHHVADPAFAAAIARHVARETEGLSLYIDELERHSPLAAPPSDPAPASP